MHWGRVLIIVICSVWAEWAFAAPQTKPDNITLTVNESVTIQPLDNDIQMTGWVLTGVTNVPPDLSAIVTKGQLRVTAKNKPGRYTFKYTMSSAGSAAAKRAARRQMPPRTMQGEISVIVTPGPSSLTNSFGVSRINRTTINEVVGTVTTAKKKQVTLQNGVSAIEAARRGDIGIGNSQTTDGMTETVSELPKPVLNLDKASVKAAETVDVHPLRNDQNVSGFGLSGTLGVPPQISVTRKPNNVLSVRAGTRPGTYSFEYVISGPAGVDYKGPVTVVVTAPLRIPVLNADNANLETSQTIDVRPLANDRNVNGFGLSGVRGVPSQISVTRKPNNVLSVRAGTRPGAYSFEYIVSGPVGDDYFGQVNVTVSGPEPVLNTDRVNLEILDNADFRPLANDQNVSGFSLSGTRGVLSQISVTRKPNNVLSIRAGNHPGNYPFQYIISGPAGVNHIGRVNVNVSLAKPPNAKMDTGYVEVGEQIIIEPLKNDSHPDGGVLTLQKLQGISSGITAKILSGNRIEVRAGLNPGTLGFQYVVEGPKNGTAVAQVNIIITPANPPNPLPDSRSVQAGQKTIFEPLANDSHPDDRVLSLKRLQGLSEGVSAKMIGGNRIEVTAGNNSGAFGFQYVVSDSKGHEAIAQVSINVTAKPNRTPIPRVDTVSLMTGEKIIISPLENDSDPDTDDTLRLIRHGTVSGLAIKILPDNRLEITAGTESGSYNFSYDIADPYYAEATSEVTVNVSPKPEDPDENTPPVIGADHYILETGTIKVVEPLTNDTDREGHSIYIKSFSSPPPGMTVRLLSGDRLELTAGEKPGDYPFKVEVADSGGLSSTAIIKTNIPDDDPNPECPGGKDCPENQPPVIVADIYSIKPMETQIIDPLFNDYDPEGEPISITDIRLTPAPLKMGLSLTSPDAFSVKVTDGNKLELTAGKNPGNYSFDIDVADLQGAISTATIPIKIERRTLPWWLLPLVAAGMIGGALLGFLARGRQSPIPAESRIRPRPQKPNDEHGVFPGSPFPMAAITPGPVPVVPLGHTIPAGLQTLTGQFSALRPAYRATGRIGFAQEGIPTNDDVSLGTGFLITPRHIMTNQHVYETYKHYLEGKECGGVEFIAERDRAASDYYQFDGQPPLVLQNLDIAIFRLKDEVTDRTPLDRVAVPTDDLDARDVVVVGYPCPFEVDEVILAAVEPDPVFAIKRLSQGVVFRHSTDTELPFGVLFKVDARINSNEGMQAVCHNASTLPGHSGSPVLCARTGELLGVHFAGSRSLFGEEAANLAMAIEFVASAEAANKGKLA